jgi:hypothetical protein
MSDRLCGPDCRVADELHIEPEVDWIGDMPIMHGESDRPSPIGHGSHRPDPYCLCGHPDYMTCPGWLDGGIAGMEIERGPNWEAR